MQHLPGPLFILSLLLLILLPCSEAKKKTKAKSETGGGNGEPTSQPTLSSGELSTKDGHRCAWAVLEGGNGILLQVRCSAPLGEGSGEAYACQFSGRPHECPAYVAKPAQYWKQVVGKLKKRSNACEGEKVLKTRLCKKGPPAAHMKLAEGRQGEGGKKSGGKDGAREKRRQAKEDEEPMQGDSDAGFQDGGEPVADAQTGESYCSEGWHSVCRFFVKLLDG